MNSDLLTMVSTSTRKILSSAFDIDCDLSDVDSSPAKSSLPTADAFPDVASLPPKTNVSEPERQNDFVT